MLWCARETDRERERDIGSKTERKTQRERERDIGSETERKTHAQRETERDRQTDRKRGRQRERQRESLDHLVSRLKANFVTCYANALIHLPVY